MHLEPSRRDASSLLRPHQTWPGRARAIGPLALTLAAYLLAAVALTWPLVRDFRTRVVGEVTYDTRHALWVMWHTTEAALGRATWPWTDALHYPYGVSLLVDGVGPLNAVLALPFWSLGPAAAYNGAALLGMALSGWCLFLLARHVLGDDGVAFVAGLLFMAWPIHLSGLYGHLEKLFVGLLPLSVLVTLVALDPQRRRTWLWAPGLVLLAALLHNGNQFMFAAFAVALVSIMQLARTPPAGRGDVLRRTVAAAIASLVLCAPVLWLILATVGDPLLAVNYGAFAWFYSPDLLQLILPSAHQAIGAWAYTSTEPIHDFVWPTTIRQMTGTPIWYGSGIETAVTIPLIALLLTAAGWRNADREGRRWLLFALAFTVLCLGPSLRVAGLARQELHVMLPYAVMRRVPGLDVMRTPGRFMMMASVGFALAAGVGLRTLGERYPRHRRLLLCGAAAIVLLECWPRPWRQMALPRVPEFYRQLAHESGRFGVLDLPDGWGGATGRASAYLYYQLVHRQPIAWAYLSRSYLRFPIDGLDGLWSGDATAASATRERLRTLGYRYVVWHKHAEELFAQRTITASGESAPHGAGAPATSNAFLRGAFAHDRPIVDDDLVTVFRVEP